MYKIGITGGIGSGKSTVASFFKKWGSAIFDADQESKKILIKSSLIQKKLINSFGKKITKNRILNLPKLAEIAFSSSLNQRIINEIMWPEVTLEIKKKENIYKKKGYSLFVVDAALIYEANLQNIFDKTILITAKNNIRLKRAINRKQITIDQIQKRMLLQMDDKEKEKLADFTIENSGSIEELEIKSRKVFNQLNIFENNTI